MDGLRRSNLGAKKRGHVTCRAGKGFSPSPGHPAVLGGSTWIDGSTWYPSFGPIKVWLGPKASEILWEVGCFIRFCEDLLFF